MLISNKSFLPLPSLRPLLICHLIPRHITHPPPPRTPPLSSVSSYLPRLSNTPSITPPFHIYLLTPHYVSFILCHHLTILLTWYILLQDIIPIFLALDATPKSFILKTIVYFVYINLPNLLNSLFCTPTTPLPHDAFNDLAYAWNYQNRNRFVGEETDIQPICCETPLPPPHYDKRR